MKKLAVFVLVVVSLVATGWAETPAKTRKQAPADTARVVDYFIGTFMNDSVKMVILRDQARPGGGITNYRFELSTGDYKIGSIASIEPGKIRGEFELEGTIFKFAATATAEGLKVTTDGETYLLKRISKLPENPFKPKNGNTPFVR